MTNRRGRPPVLRQRILAVLLAHHRAAGWDKAMPRAELLALLHGWRYGRQITQREDNWGAQIPMTYTGIDQSQVDPQTYRAAQVALGQALLGLFGQGLVKLGSLRQPKLETAQERMAEIEASLQDAPAAFARNQALGPLAPTKADTLEEFVAKRRRVLALWQAGRGQPSDKVQLVALTETGIALAEDFLDSMPSLSSQGKSTQTPRAP